MRLSGTFRCTHGVVSRRRVGNRGCTRGRAARAEVVRITPSIILLQCNAYCVKSCMAALKLDTRSSWKKSSRHLSWETRRRTPHPLLLISAIHVSLKGILHVACSVRHHPWCPNTTETSDLVMSIMCSRSSGAQKIDD